MHNVKSGPSSDLTNKKPLQWQPYVPEHIATLVPYKPGKPIEETKREYGITEIVKLASNENPLGPSPKALEALQQALPSIHLYPDGSHHALKTAMSKDLGCDTKELIFTNGSNEAIDLIIRAFVPKEANIITHKAAFVVYKLCAQLQGCGCIEAPIDSELKVNVDDLLRAIQPETKLAILANPNNPTGTFLTRDEIFKLAQEYNRRKILFVLDYAYWEYVTEKNIPDPLETFKEFPNVIILRTFSKIYGLAGLRIGYALARSEIISILERTRQPFNVASISLIGAKAALSDQEHVRRSAELNIKSKKHLIEGLAPFKVKVYECQGNFILVDMFRRSEELYPEFLKRGVIIRPVSSYGLTTHFRVTCGLISENEKFLKAMAEIKT